MKTLQLPLKNNKWNLNPNSAGFALSLMLHIALVLGLINGIKTINIQEEGQHSITMNLSSFNPMPQKVAKPQEPKEQIKEIKKPSPSPVQATPQEVVQNAPQNPTDSVENHNNQIQTLSYKDGEQNEVLLKIKSAIDKNNKYPPMAQRNGIEGEVLISFVLDQNGEILEIKVLEESKHKIFNKAAIRAIRNAKAEFPILQKPIRIEIPIAYKLI